MITETETAAASAAPCVRTCNALLIFPRFNANSFWALTDTCRMQGAKAPAPPLGLMTVAALLPQTWTFKLVNRNTEEVSEADFAWADLVLTGGMLPQSADTRQLIAMCKERGVPVAVGGPDPTSRPEAYAAADLLVCGEFEGIVHEFVAAWERGERQGRFTAPKFKADVTTTPLPRYDLIKFEDYLWVNLQFSRGCPFTCEFCDIIELYGRVPRTKTTAQVLAELDRLWALGHRGHVDFVDDNLIGNKKALKKFLPELRRWQVAHGTPFRFSTEASLNLADDDELLQMMRHANFFVVFIGIESGDEATLVSMQKKQNTRRSIADSLQKIYAAGMFVTAGFILGFDTEREGAAEQMMATITATSIPISIVGLLVALPNTQLNRRLQKEGRLVDEFDASFDHGDQCTAGLNFATLRPKSDIMRDYVNVLRTAYGHEAFFARLTHMLDSLDPPEQRVPAGRARRFDPQRTLRTLKTVARLFREVVLKHPGDRDAIDERFFRRNVAIVGRVLKEISWHRPDLFVPVWAAVLHCRKTNPSRLPALFANLCMYFHVSKFTAFVVAQTEERIRTLEAREETPADRSPVAVTVAA